MDRFLYDKDLCHERVKVGWANTCSNFHKATKLSKAGGVACSTPGLFYYEYEDIRIKRFTSD